MSIPHISVSNLAWFCSLYASALSSSSDLVRIVFFDGCYRDFSSVHELDIVFLSDKLGLYNMVYFLLDQLHASNEEHIFQLGSTASLCHSQMTLSYLLTLARMRSEGYGSCPVCVCVCVCPRPSSATRATKRQTRHTGGLSIVLASVKKRRFSYNGFVSEIAMAFPYLR